jgi:histidine ammonia-lyase
VDSVPTSGGKEDHVSMGMTCALKFRHLVELAERALAIELIAAAEGMEHRRPLKASVPIEQIHAAIRTHVAPLTQDRSLSQDIETVAALLRDGQLDTRVESIWQLIP